ncbi:TPA: hypothetical protein ACX96Z_000140 [Clostridium sporogenes]
MKVIDIASISAKGVVVSICAVLSNIPDIYEILKKLTYQIK